MNNLGDFNNPFPEMIGMIPAIEMKLLATGAALILLTVGRALLFRFVVQHYGDDPHTSYQVRKLLSYLVAAVALLVIGRIWLDAFSVLATFLGLASAGLAIALRDLLVDMAAWFFIVWRQPFREGDRIQIGNISGDVIDIRLFQFTLLEIGNWVDADQSTGRVIHVPNGRVFIEPQANYHQGFQYIWDEIAVRITFESNWHKARGILQAIASRHTGCHSAEAQAQVRKAAEKYLIFYSKLTPTVYLTVKEYGIVLTLRFLSAPRRRRGTEQALWEDILQEFAACPDISLAYPTQRFYTSTLDGPVQPYHAPDLPGPNARPQQPNGQSCVPGQPRQVEGG